MVWIGGKKHVGGHIGIGQRVIRIGCLAHSGSDGWEIFSSKAKKEVSMILTEIFDWLGRHDLTRSIDT